MPGASFLRTCICLSGLISGLTAAPCGAWLFALNGAYRTFDPVGSPVRLLAVYRFYDSGASSWRTDVDPAAGTLRDGQVAYFISPYLTNGIGEAHGNLSAISSYYHSGAGCLMDEVQAPGSAWQVQTDLGFLFSQVQPGTAAVQLYTNQSGRHLTQMEGDAVKDGYSFYKTLGYAFPRYGTNGEEFVTLSKGGTDWKFNKTAGCALWHVVYDGFQFVNNHDLGRQIQGGAQWYLSDGIRTNRYACAEAGMGCGQYDFADPVTRMGSPVQYCYTNEQGALLTKILPLENVYAHAADYYESSPLKPVLYQDLYFRKEITAGVQGMDRVLCWKQVFCVPESFTAGNTNIVWSHNGVAASCLKASVTNLWVYNAVTGSLTDKTDSWWNGGANKQFADYHVTGKCIIMGYDTNHCYGLMAKDTEDGGSIDFWMGYYWKSRGPIEEKGEFSANIVNMNGHNDQSWRQGENCYIVYLITGTLANVTNDAQTLFDRRDSVSW